MWDEGSGLENKKYDKNFSEYKPWNSSIIIHEVLKYSWEARFSDLSLVEIW